MDYKVSIIYYDSGIKQSTTFTKEVSSFDDLKQAFLKRFGNINSAPNKALKEKPLVKQLTHTAETIEEWVLSIESQTRWEIEVLEGVK